MIDPDDGETLHAAGEVVRVSFELTRDEFRSWFNWYLLHQRGIRWVAGATLIMIAAGAVLLAASSTGIGAFFIGVGVFQVVWLLATMWAVGRRVWSRRGPDATDQVIELSDRGVHIVTANTDSQTKWSIYGRAVEHGGLYLLGSRSGRAYRIIPRRAFATAGDERAFRQILRAHVDTDLTLDPAG